MTIVQTVRVVPKALNIVDELKKLDSEMAGYVAYLAETKEIEPGDLIDTTERMAHLAKARAVLVEVTKYFYTIETHPVGKPLNLEEFQ